MINFAFTLLEEGDKAYSAAGNHCIAIIKETESYNSLKLALQNIIEDVQTLTSITINGYSYSIEYYLGGDWKFLAMVTGIDSASSNYACIWCKCPMLERHITDVKWSMFDPKYGCRTIEENIIIATSASKEFNVSHQPLFPMIPLTHVVVDNLHMFLRVADTLVDLLIGSLRTMDKVKQTSHIRSLDKLTNLKTFEICLKQMGISGYTFWIGKQSKQLKWRTLTGPEKLLVFSNINIPATFPTLEYKDEIQKLWEDLLALHQLFSVKPDDLQSNHIVKFEAASKAFVQDFVNIYPAKHVTPYMHCMMQHVSEFMDTYGSILQFTQQGLEKYNDVMTKDYFRSTSHHNEQSLIQILQKQNRLEHLENLGAKHQKKHQITCSNCKQPGHNKWTCTAPCANCGESQYKSHLIKVGRSKVAKCVTVENDQ